MNKSGFTQISYKQKTRRGRPSMTIDEKKKPITVRLRGDIAQWLREQDESQAVLIEDALVKVHKLGKLK